ncbi:hypothetical protein XENOCAPTIV_004534 [Xenoophorus captivus]|uniref:Uncharacterized protein n=1 Tax=Xenoophorus captivus TaxID=1517983 RepID=A0ABV0R6U2_9TELE
MIYYKELCCSFCTMLGLACNDLNNDDSRLRSYPVENSSLVCPWTPYARESGNFMDKDVQLWQKQRSSEQQDFGAELEVIIRPLFMSHLTEE